MAEGASFWAQNTHTLKSFFETILEGVFVLLFFLVIREMAPERDVIHRLFSFSALDFFHRLPYTVK